MQVASIRLAITEWTNFLYLAETLAALGILLGLALGYSRFERGRLYGLTLGYSVVLLTWQISLVIPGHMELLERLISVGGRLSLAFSQFLQHQPVEDSLLFLVFITVVMWCLSLFSAYGWARHENYLAAVLPGGLFALVIHLYDPLVVRRIWVLGIYILLALLLLGRKTYLENSQTWRAKRIFQMQDASFDLMRGMTIAATLLVLLTWSMPASASGWESAIRSWKRLIRPWREAQQWLSTAVEPLQKAAGRPGGDFYGNHLDLGIGTPLTETVVFTAKVNSLPREPARLYWRGYVYDTYTHQGWTNSYAQPYAFTPDLGPLQIFLSSNPIPARFTIKTQIKQALLYLPSQPVWVSRPGHIEAATTPNEERDVAAWYAEPRLQPGEQYKIQVSLSNPSIQELRAAGTEYPAWISERYLQLPEDFSPRIRALAEQIVAGQASPYDQAAAITLYLRNELEYTNPLPAHPPKGADPLEWVLFESKKAFCNYYATAEVLMLRSLGIPARLAVGFSEGEFDGETLLIIRNLNAHAWPEVYFPGLGWVEFEPTANQSPLIRPNLPETSETAPETPSNESHPPDLFENKPPHSGHDLEKELEISSSSQPKTALPLLLGVAGLALSALWLLDRRYALLRRLPLHLQAIYEKNDRRAPSWLIYWTGWTLLTPFQRSFETVNLSLRLLGEPPALFYTPAERAHALEQHLPEAASAIHTLLTQHQASLFTPQKGHLGQSRRASLTIWLYTLRKLFHRTWQAFTGRFGISGQFS
ncbi:MAG: transglutaminaseTgpA domain-containing protein [Anaerolineales bacterium]